ncbi:MAG: hypothetical protein ACI8TP_004709 [Acidimicrobiales bacterium]|jgi:hypothetical protein
MPTIPVRLILSSLAILGLLATACGDDSTTDAGVTTSTTTTAPASPSTEPGGPPDLASIEALISCGDAVFIFASPDDRTLVRIDIPGALADIEGVDGRFERSYDLADPTSAATATLESGSGLGSSACNDIQSRDFAIEVSETATAGSVSLSVEDVPAGPLKVCETGFDATLTIEDVQFPVGDAELDLRSLTLSGAIGWCPG